MTARRRLNQILLILLLGTFSPSLVLAADRAEKASEYYEDALVRMERNDAKGAIIQLKNALQQDAKMLPALVLLGKAYLKEGDLANADRMLADAEKLGADRSEIIAMQVEVYQVLGRNKELLERFSPDGLPPSVKYKVLVTRAYAQMDLGQEQAAIQSLEQARRIDPSNPAALVAQSKAYLNKNNFSEALLMAQLAIAKGPSDPATWNMKASIAHAQGNLQDALADYGKALALEPDYLDALIARSSLLLDMNRDKEAARDAEVLKQKFPGDPRSAYIRALLAERQGKNVEARNALVAATSALDALPFEAVATHPQLLLLGGMSHYSLGQYEKAKTYLSGYLKKFPGHMGARKVFTSILLNEKDYASAIAFMEGPARARPDDPQALSMLATAYMATGQHTKAVSLLEQASEMTGGKAADISANYGLSLIGSGQEDKGVAELQRAYAKNPGSSRSGVPLALMYLKQNQPKPALQVLLAVSKNEPDNLTALNLLAFVRGQTGDRAGARRTYEQVLEKNPQLTATKLNLARLDLMEGKPADARRRLLEVLKNQPKNLDAHFELAQLELKAGSTQEAVRWLEKARSLNPQSLRPNLMLVDLYLDMGDAKKALDVAKDAQAGSRENLQALAALGRAYLAIGNRGLARENFKRISQLAGFDATWQQRAAQLQISAGDYEGARYSLDKALLGKPEYFPALYLKAVVEKAAGNLDLAEQQARALLAGYPREAMLHQLLGDIAMQRKRYDDAILAYRTAYDQVNDTQQAISLYRAYIQSGNVSKALEFAQSWARRKPADLPAQRTLAEAYGRAGKLAESQQLYETLSKKLPKDVYIHNDLTYVMLQRGDPGALAVAEKAYQLAPSDASVLDNLGWALVQAGQTEKGLRYLREAQVRVPNSPEIRGHLDEALKRLGRQR